MRAILNRPRAVFEPSLAALLHTLMFKMYTLLTPSKTRFALSASEKWDSMGGHFDMEVWYNDMVETFEDDPEDPKAVSIIHHWNVFVVFVFIDLSNSISQGGVWTCR